MQRQRTRLAALLVTAGAALVLNCRPEVARQKWNKEWGPLVPHKTFPADCGLCHTTEAWGVLRRDFSFDHTAQTGYVLDGAHAQAACLRCHNDRGPVSAYLARGCGGCHPDPHASSLGMDCQKCHEQTNWRPTGSIADHAKTGFHLVAAHAVAPCESCHLQAAAGQFRGAPRLCELCHQENLASTTAPDHVANRWLTNCERCHSPAGWTPASFQHAFPLVAQHNVACSECHTAGSTSTFNCLACHEQADTDDKHGDVDGYSYSSQACYQCHSNGTAGD